MLEGRCWVTEIKKLHIGTLPGVTVLVAGLSQRHVNQEGVRHGAFEERVLGEGVSQGSLGSQGQPVDWREFGSSSEGS